ncbi:hypothetical protein BV898_16809 [Hypsibius exemplaris]|uniref:Phorbol-ester/DAG-type domain-containing protein n=1 Tax=Hypsibius exemplaris TaxID=2072580 RepID=A0A9X6RLK4_HYPEX|nr:hypothetical protein BV898_16809 [Hypsibius exemplaris]
MGVNSRARGAADLKHYQGEDDYGKFRGKTHDPHRPHRKLARETIETEEDFLGYVGRSEKEVRRSWSQSERQAAELRALVEEQRSRAAMFDKKADVMRQLLGQEMERRRAYESQVAELENVSQNLRDILRQDVDMPVSDEQRLHYRSFSRHDTATDRYNYQSTRDASIHRRHSTPSKKPTTNDDFVDRWNEENFAAQQKKKAEQPEKRERDRKEKIRSVKVISDRTSGEFATKPVKMKEGDVEIIITTNMRIPEDGPVEAVSTFKTIPGKRVSFAEKMPEEEEEEDARRNLFSVWDEPDNRSRRGHNESELESLRCHISPAHSSSEDLSPDASRRAQWKTRLEQDRQQRVHFYAEKCFLKAGTCLACKQGIAFGNTERVCVVCQRACHAKCAESGSAGPCVPTSANSLDGKQKEIEISHHRGGNTGAGDYRRDDPGTTAARPHDVYDGMGAGRNPTAMEGGSGSRCPVKAKKSLFNKVMSCLKPSGSAVKVQCGKSRSGAEIAERSAGHILGTEV